MDKSCTAQQKQQQKKNKQQQNHNTTTTTTTRTQPFLLLLLLLPPPPPTLFLVDTMYVDINIANDSLKPYKQDKAQKKKIKDIQEKKQIQNNKLQIRKRKEK